MQNVVEMQCFADNSQQNNEHNLNGVCVNGVWGPGLSAKGSVGGGGRSGAGGAGGSVGGCVPAATGKMAALTSLTQVKMQLFTSLPQLKPMIVIHKQFIPIIAMYFNLTSNCL